MMKFRRAALLASLSGVLFWFLFDASGVRDAVSQALSLCARSVVPAMFPFLVVSSLLLSLGLGDLAAPWLAGLMEPLFRVGGPGSAALVLGVVGGYPIGARATADLYRARRLTRDEAQRLLAFANTANPVFFLSVLGAGVFGSVRTGLWLWLIHLLAALLTGLLFRRRGAFSPGADQWAPQAAPSFPTAFVEAVGASLRSILSVCAFIIFFSVLVRPLTRLGGPAGPVLVGLTELFSLTPLLSPDAFGFVLAAGAAGWGGLSVLCQTAAVLEGSGLGMGSCMAGKCCHGILSALLAALLASHALG